MNKKLEFISERFSRDLMIGPAWSSAGLLLVNTLILPSNKETSILQGYFKFYLFILFIVYF